MTIESDRDFSGLRRSGRVVALALREMKCALEPGMTTAELDAVGAALFERSSPRMTYGFPGVNLISVNDEAAHGVPGCRIIEAGDLVKLDVTAEVAGYAAAVTVALAPVHEELKVCAGLAFARASSVARAGLHYPLRAERPRGREDHPRASHNTQLLRQKARPSADRGACNNHRADHSRGLRPDHREPGRQPCRPPRAHHRVITKGSPIVLTAA